MKEDTLKQLHDILGELNQTTLKLTEIINMLLWEIRKENKE